VVNLTVIVLLVVADVITAPAGIVHL
jgi:hypothetical protein